MVEMNTDRKAAEAAKKTWDTPRVITSELVANSTLAKGTPLPDNPVGEGYGS